MVQKTKRLNPIAHTVAEIGALKREIPDGRFIKQTPKSFVWECSLKPTPLSLQYTIKILYTYGEAPKVFVTDPYPLDKYPGKEDLPHVYSTELQRICLYYPGIGEWNKEKFIAKTIVPWASEWLLYYELWVSTGLWLGEGLHPSSKKKQDRNEKTTK